MKKTLLSLILLTSWAADVLMVFSLHTQSYPPPRHHYHISRSRIANSDRSVPLVDDMASILQPRTISSRDSSCDSSTDFSKPLLIGVVAGIFGTLFIQGFVLVLFRIYHKNQQLKAHPHQHLQHHQYQHGQIPIPSAPMDFRHLEHIAMSHQAASSPVGSTASLLRIAHRRADGSWAFTDAMDASDGRSEISSISPYASPLPTPLSHRFPPSPRGTPSVPHSVSVGPRQSMDTITTSPGGGGGGGGGYEKSVYSVNTQVVNHQQHHSPMPSLSRSAFSSSYSPHTSTIYPPPPQSPTASVSPSMSMSVSVMSGPPPMPSSKQQYHIQNLPPPSSAPPPLPLPPLPTPTSSMRSENVDPVIPAETSISSSTSRMENSSLSPSRAESSPSRTRIEDDVGSTRTGPPPYAAYIPTWREQQQMQNMPPLPLPLPFPPPEKGRHRN